MQRALAPRHAAAALAALWMAGLAAPVPAQIESQQLAPLEGTEAGRQVRRPPSRPGEGGLLPDTTTERSWIAPPVQGTPVPAPEGLETPGEGVAVLPVPEDDTMLPGAEPLPPDDAAGDGGGGRTTLLPGARTARGTAEATAEDGEAPSFFDRFLRAPPGTGQGERPLRPVTLGATREAAGAEFRVLDMIAGTTETLAVGTGEMAVSGRLRLRLVACEVPVTGGVGSVALVQVWDSKDAADTEPEFSGWMFAESPALSALDHPRYDVWLISCSTEAAEAESGIR